MFSFLRLFLSACLFLLFLLTGIQAQDTLLFHAKQPVLITSAGQSSDVLMIKILAQQAGVSFKYDKIASPTMLDSVKSVIIVSGGSSKGLGEASIDKEQELQRLKDIIARAKKDTLPIIGIHVGGKSRRGELSDYFNKPVAENADYLIVVKEGDYDSFFSKIADQRKIGISLPEKINDIRGILQEIYEK
jgi:hypothetical protein